EGLRRPGLRADAGRAGRQVLEDDAERSVQTSTTRTERRREREATGGARRGRVETDRPDAARPLLRQNAAIHGNSQNVRRNSARFQMVEGKGFEPSTSALRTPRSPN